MTKTQRIFLIIGSIIALIIGFMYATGIYKYWSLLELKQNAEHLTILAQAHPIIAPVCYLLFYIAYTALSIPEAVILTIAGGFLFGAVKATCYITIGATIGGTISFLTIRYLVGKKIQKKYASHFVRFNRAIKTYGASYLLMVRFIVIVPFFLVNILAALTPIPLSTFIITTAIGIIPGTFVYALAGEQLHAINSLQDIFTPRTILLLAMLALLAGASIFIQKWWHQKTSKKSRG